MPIPLETALQTYTKRVCATDPQFGAVPNTNADQWAAIQSALDYALENNILNVDLPGGLYKISKTLHLGYGVNPQFTSVRLHGAGANYLDDGTATTIQSTFVDRPIINIQGTRNGGVSGCHIIGPTAITNPSGQSLAWRADAANYIPAGAANAERAPFCGVCIDGYSGLQSSPTTPYPVPTYPAYLGLGTVTDPYGRAFSSAAFVRDCVVENTNIGVLGSPNSDNNNDFLDLSGTMFNYLNVCVALGNSQARNTNFENVNCNCFHTGFDGITYGGAAGNFAGNWDNIHTNTFYRIFNIALNWNSPIILTGFYSEVGMRFGDFGGPGQLIAESCHIDVADFRQGATEIYSESPIIGDGGLVFRNCRFLYFRSSFEAQCSNVQFDGCSFTAAPWRDTVVDPELAALESFGGVFLPYTPNRPSVRSRLTRSSGTFGTLNGTDDSTSQNWHSFGSNEYVLRSYMVPQFNRACSIGLTSPIRSGRTVTATAPTGFPFALGDVFWAENVGYYFITAYNSGTGAITLQAVSGYKYDGTTYTPLVSTSFTNWYYFPRGAVEIEPQRDLFFKTTAASATLEVVDADGAAASVPAGITTASKPFWLASALVNDLAKAVPFPALTTVSSVGSTSLTMSNNALTSGTWAIGPGIVKLK